MKIRRIRKELLAKVSGSRHKVLAKINSTSDQAQMTFFLWLLAVVDVAGFGVICLLMAPPSTDATVAGWSLIASSVLVVQAVQVGRISCRCRDRFWNRWGSTIVRLFQISPDSDESADAHEVFGAAYVRDLPRIIGG